jgi:hypothetical protein
MTNLPEITEILRHYPWSKEAVQKGYQPVFSRMGINPAQRAKVLVEDMESIGCDWPIRSIPGQGEVVLSHYEIPGTDFGRVDEEDVPEVTKAHGSGLNWGSVVRLSKACEIGRRHFGSDWALRFKKQLLNAKDHLSFIEEILWLNLWYGISNIQYEAKPFCELGYEKQVDWKFMSCGQTINLEIKYRPKDWMRHVDGSDFNIVMPEYYYDVPAKFPHKFPNELNLVGVSSPAPIDRSLCERTEILLRRNPTIDGILIWSQASSGSSPFEVHALKDHNLIKTLFTGGDFEDAAHIGIFRHLWRKRDERRAYRAGDVPELLQKLSGITQQTKDGSSPQI